LNLNPNPTADRLTFKSITLAVTALHSISTPNASNAPITDASSSTSAIELLLPITLAAELQHQPLSEAISKTSTDRLAASEASTLSLKPRFLHTSKSKSNTVAVTDLPAVVAILILVKSDSKLPTVASNWCQVLYSSTKPLTFTATVATPTLAVKSLNCISVIMPPRRRPPVPHAQPSSHPSPR